MGAWDVGSFDNDDALDWVYELEEAADLSLFGDTLQNVIRQKDDYLEAPDCAVAISAAEVVAALSGRPAGHLPEEVSVWVKDRPAPSAEMVLMAQAALAAVLDRSELKELWEESDSFVEWQASVREVQSRLVAG